MSWRESQLKIFWDSWPIPCPVVTFPCWGCHPSKVPQGWCSALQLQPAQPALAVPLLSLQQEGSFTSPFLPLAMRKAPAYHRGRSIFNYFYQVKQLRIYLLIAFEWTNWFFRLLWNKTRIPFNIHWFFFFFCRGRITCPLNIWNTMSFNIYFGINTCFTFCLNSSLLKSSIEKMCSF